MPIILVIWKGEIKKTEVGRAAWSKVSKTPTEKITQACWHVLVIPATWEAKDRRTKLIARC
jgi:hypothetical protein